MRIRLRVNNAATLYMLFAAIFWGVHIIKMQPLVSNFFVALVGLCALAYSILKKKVTVQNAYLILGGVLYSVFMTVSLIYNGNGSYLDLLWIWAYMGIAILTYEFDIPEWVYWIIAYSIAVLIFIYIIMGGTARELLSMGSQNNISAYLIFFVVMGYLSAVKGKKAINLLPSFFTLVICMWTESRAGIVSAALLLAETFLYNYFAISGEKGRSSLKLVALIGFAAVAANCFFGKYLVGLAIKIDRYGGGSIRTEIWREYMQSVGENVGNFFWGPNTSNEMRQWLSFYDGNPHNSFLVLHARFGLFAVVTLFICLFLAARKAIKKKNYLLIAAFGASSARMFFDWIAFPGLYDVLFWYMYLYVLDERLE